VNDLDNTPRLYRRAIPNAAWYIQAKEGIERGKRTVDRMSISDIAVMYRDAKFLCDTCGKSLGKFDFDLKDHIIHLVNPSFVWSCEDCIIDDMKNGRIIAETPDRPSWQQDYV
jgi:hypothetical protein